MTVSLFVGYTEPESNYVLGPCDEQDIVLDKAEAVRLHSMLGRCLAVKTWDDEIILKILSNSVTAQLHQGS